MHFVVISDAEKGKKGKRRRKRKRERKRKRKGEREKKRKIQREFQKNTLTFLPKGSNSYSFYLVLQKGNWNMRINRYTLATIAAAAFAGLFLAGGTYAYLTDQDEKLNTFTVGNVDITLEEPIFDNEHNNEKELVPNQEINKDPTVKITTDVPSILFVEITSPKLAMTKIAADGTKAQSRTTEDPFDYFHMEVPAGGKDAVKTGGFSNRWIRLEQLETPLETSGTKTYVFAYSKVMTKDTSTLAGAGKTEPVFDKVKLKNFLEAGTNGYKDMKIDIKAYAIQASYVNDGKEYAAGQSLGNSDSEALKSIYAAYFKQNGR